MSKHVVPLPSIWIVFFVPFDCWVGFGWVWLGWFVLGLFGCLDWLGSTKQKIQIESLIFIPVFWVGIWIKRYKLHKNIENVYFGDVIFPF